MARCRKKDKIKLTHYREVCIAAGMDDYLAKPFNMNELADMLYRWKGEAVTLTQPAVEES